MLKNVSVEVRNQLQKVNATDSIYTAQKENLALLIDVCEPAVITSEVEEALFARYKKASDSRNYDIASFITDVLANRYFLQKDYAKSFLLHHDISKLKSNPVPELLDEIEAFYLKPDKNPMEKYIAGKLAGERTPEFLNFLRGIIALRNGEFELAKNLFQQSTYYNSPIEIPRSIFGYNRIECFDCEDMMAEDYAPEFAFIPETMDFLSLTKTLIKLQGIGKTDNGAKANYLIGNFYYNCTSTGYYRYVLRFGTVNYNFENSAFRWDAPEPDIYDDVYFKNYKSYFKDPVAISRQYLEKAYKQKGNDELKARIAFALSKCEQEEFYIENKVVSDWSSYGKTLIKNREYFAELAKYDNTRFYEEVRTNCKYFEYYVNHYVN